MVHHAAYIWFTRTQDADTVAARLKQDGVKVAMQMREATDNIFSKSFIVEDNNGNWIQFCQLTSTSRSR